MTYESLKHLPPTVAAGVASRAALSIHHTRTTSTSTEIEDEHGLRSSLIDEIRHAFGLGDKSDPITLEVIVTQLYEYSDSLLERFEEWSSGFFTIDSNLKENQILARRIARENKIIAKTISYPTKVFQAYVGQKGGIVRFECVFVREVEGTFPFYEFVIARKAGRTVHVTQVLRMYPNVNNRITLPEGQINLLLNARGDKLTADELAQMLQTQFPKSTLIIIYATDWVFSYFTGGETQPTRDLKTLFGDGYLDGFQTCHQYIADQINAQAPGTTPAS